MSRSPSPASSLDFYQSDLESEEEYTPRQRAPTKRRAVPPASGAGGGKKGGPTIKINLRAIREANDLAAQYPTDGNVEGDDGVDNDEGGDIEALIGRRGVDLSGQDLVRDHDLRPLWVDELGNMYVLPFHLCALLLSC